MSVYTSIIQYQLVHSKATNSEIFRTVRVCSQYVCLVNIQVSLFLLIWLVPKCKVHVLNNSHSRRQCINTAQKDTLSRDQYRYHQENIGGRGREPLLDPAHAAQWESYMHNSISIWNITKRLMQSNLWTLPNTMHVSHCLCLHHILFKYCTDIIPSSDSLLWNGNNRVTLCTQIMEHTTQVVHWGPHPTTHSFLLYTLNTDSEQPWSLSWKAISWRKVCLV